MESNFKIGDYVFFNSKYTLKVIDIGNGTIKVEYYNLDYNIEFPGNNVKFWINSTHLTFDKKFHRNIKLNQILNG